MTHHARHTLAFVLALGLAGSPLMARENLVTPFSGLTNLPGSAWESLEFPDIDQHSQYQLVQQDGQQVVLATSSDSASGLIHRVAVEPGDSLILRWRWKVANVLEEGDARRKSGDDYPARIYVAFEFEPDKASWFERAKRKTVSALFGEELPGKALNYIWANRLPQGDMIANPFTGDTMMIAVNSGQDQLGQWVTVERDIVADYRRAFGDDPPELTGVAIMTDTDNTGGTARAWYGDITLLTPDK
ncbi:DUF3047 domain-containing protein [Marinobacter zhanjiangensis]|uniref:DUF3047 domain-containing protein n=1 Tax=Marinobacter zhanjiangensis TaxID=578215 RepID=A0ABQ3APU0_9GAMM|nr:DUF3047 domain-containing protein [Marinobacter zhanjiangensis]GGY62013.1 hypothetical protein GCM10007071_06100 [Marinobacter zhanjiangensis]